MYFNNRYSRNKYVNDKRYVNDMFVSIFISKTAYEHEKLYRIYIYLKRALIYSRELSENNECNEYFTFQ